MWPLDEPRIVIVEGQYGTGKTAFASALLVELAGGLDCPLWANWTLQGATRLSTWDEVQLCEDGVVGLDEFHDTLNARRSSSNQNLEVMRWGGQVRKKGCHLVLISQMAGKIDLQLRLMANVVYTLAKAPKRHARDYRSVVTVREVNQGAGRMRVVNRFVWDRSQAFGLYDHREIVLPLEAAPLSARTTAAARG